MACNCGKRTRPMGSGRPAAGKGQDQTEGKGQEQAGSKKRQSFVLKDSSGKTQTFGSRLERDAALRRMGR